MQYIASWDTIPFKQNMFCCPMHPVQKKMIIHKLCYDIFDKITSYNQCRSFNYPKLHNYTVYPAEFPWPLYCVGGGELLFSHMNISQGRVRHIIILICLYVHNVHMLLYQSINHLLSTSSELLRHMWRTLFFLLDISRNCLAFIVVFFYEICGGFKNFSPWIYHVTVRHLPSSLRNMWGILNFFLDISRNWYRWGPRHLLLSSFTEYVGNS